MVFSCLLKRYGPNLQNDTRLETTSCFIAEKMALDEPFLVSGRDLACQQKVLLALTKTSPICYYNVVDSAFSNYAGVVAYLTPVNTAYRVTHLYANGIYARDEHHAMNLVFWIETFIFIRVLLFKWNQWNDVIIFLTNKSRQ